jgi:MoxR-like ATPase
MSDEVVSKSFRGELDQGTVNYLQGEVESQREALVSKRKKMVENNPEAFVYYYGMQLKQMREGLGNGEIIETPYVKSKIERITESVAIGRPVFVHGELGSGKTELAKHISRKYLSKDHLSDWEQKNPKPKDKAKLVEWMSMRETETEPLLISGSRDMTSEQIIGARSIKKGETLSPEDQIKLIDNRWQDYIKSSGNKVDNPETKQMFFDSYKEALKSPVLVEVTLGPLMKAMQEGRPLIIDEMNAIPHHLLIMMNDLLTRKPGDMITPLVPGAESFRIKKGFCVLATGNYKPEDGVFYVGRQPVDAAFLSRFDLVKYDYLPNNLINEPEGLNPEEQRNFRAENELTQMLIVRLLNKDLSGDLPEWVFKQVGNLARVARMVQDVFSGVKDQDIPLADDGANQLPASDVLKENVLSIRHLLPILDKWKANGFTKELDVYIYDEYINRSGARPKEKLYLYKLMKTVGGFFDDGVGWPELGKTQEILNFKTDGLVNFKPEVRSFNQVEVIQNLFGEKPELLEVKKKFTDPENYGISSSEKSGSEEVVNDSEFLERISTLMEVASIINADLNDGVKNYEDFLKLLGQSRDEFLKKFKKTDEQLKEIVEAIIEEGSSGGGK